MSPTPDDFPITVTPDADTGTPNIEQIGAGWHEIVYVLNAAQAETIVTALAAHYGVDICAAALGAEPEKPKGKKP